MRTLVAAAAAAFALVATSARAEKISLLDARQSLVLGAGKYYYPLERDNAFDPIPRMAPTGVEIKSDLALLPIKAGLQFESEAASLELYGRYIIALSEAYTASDGSEGTMSWRGYGGGATFGATLVRDDVFRVSFVLNGEFDLHSATLKDDAGGKVDLSSTGMLVGFGLKPELYLGDMWVLSLAAIYQYGFAGEWSGDGNFIGHRFSGTIEDPKNGNAVLAQHGGLLVEASLRLLLFK